MIVVKRKPTQAIVIDNRVFIAVSKLQADTASLAITCPECTRLTRLRDPAGRTNIAHAEEPLETLEALPCPVCVPIRRYDVLKINDNISIEVVECRAEYVRLGVTTSREVPIQRKEVWDSVK